MCLCPLLLARELSSELTTLDGRLKQLYSEFQNRSQRVMTETPLRINQRAMYTMQELVARKESQLQSLASEMDRLQLAAAKETVQEAAAASGLPSFVAQKTVDDSMTSESLVERLQVLKQRLATAPGISVLRQQDSMQAPRDHEVSERWTMLLFIHS